MWIMIIIIEEAGNKQNFIYFISFQLRKKINLIYINIYKTFFSIISTEQNTFCPMNINIILSQHQCAPALFQWIEIRNIDY